MSGVAATRDSLDTDQIPRAQNPWGRRRLTMTNATVRGAPYAVAAYALGVVAAHPWMDRWGSTAAERTLGLAGDELVPDAAQQTHAITIDAPPEAVWPWLVQMGQDRAGFYSHDRLERLVGADIRNADEIHPEWQHLAVGDLVRTYRPMPRFEPLGWLVAMIEPPRLLVVQEPERGGIINSSWAFVLERGNPRTRLLSRWRFRRRGPAHTAFKWLVFDPAHFIMETGVLHGLKTRVQRQPPMTLPLDIDALVRRQVDADADSAYTRAGLAVGVASEGAIGGVR
jgi:hypothetical protein